MLTANQTVLLVLVKTKQMREVRYTNRVNQLAKLSKVVLSCHPAQKINQMTLENAYQQNKNKSILAN